MFPPAPRRGRAHAAARRHTAWVRTLKIAIPAVALVAAAGIAAATLYNPFGRMPGLTLGPISLSGQKIKMEGPKLTGFRHDSRPYEVTATAAFQDIRRPNVIELKDMKARLVLDETGNAARLASPAGLFDATKEHLELTEDIRIATDKGEEAQLRSASIDFKAGTVETKDPVRISTPSLSVEADSMRISDNGRTAVFTGRVRTQLLPSPRKGAGVAGDLSAPLVRQAEAGRP